MVKRPLLISLGVTPDGHREILGVDMAITESEDTWRKHHRRLKERGIRSVNLTISDAHKGLVKVMEEKYPGTPHQRCMVHFAPVLAQ